MQASPYAKHSGLRALLCAALTSLLLAACTPQSQEEASDKIAQPAEKVTGDLVRAKQRWTDTGIRDYQFILSRVCECQNDGYIHVVVENGTVSRARYVPSGQAVSAELLQTLPSIDSLFDAMIDAANRPLGRVTWTPNKDYHYPEHAHIEPEGSALDADVSYWLRDFSH